MGSTVFLSYARQDTDRVRHVYKSMKEAGLEPWMDAPPPPYQLEGLTPGMAWEDVLRKQLREARVTLVCMSKVSVAKEGYVQKEYRLALSACAMKASGTASLIPVLLDDCTPPDYRVDTISLHDLHWYKLYEQGIENLVLHLRAIITPDQASTVPTADYMSLIAEVNHLRMECDWQIAQVDKLRNEIAQEASKYNNLLAKHESAQEERYLDESKRFDKF